MISQKGLAQIFLVLIAALGLVSYFIISNTFNFKDKLFSQLYPKPASKAADTTDTSYNMGVLVIKYFPLTSDGQNIDINVTGDVGEPYNTIRQRTVDITNQLKIYLGNATRYLGYKDSTVQPALSYQITDTKEYTLAVPMLSDGTRKPDYNGIMSSNNICDYVDNKGVREVWLWAYQGPTYPGSSYPYLNISESKMAGPFGDISNSPRYNDMPLCQNTYRVYTFNYGRYTAEAMESWGHQIEAELDVINRDLFRSLWQGPNYPQTLGVNGRCGSVHNPPNARSEYDRANPNSQQSDCFDWNPDSLGILTDISCQNWGCSDIDPLSNNASLNYMIWNWQNLPGRLNTKTYQGLKLRNWWDIHGDFDTVMGTDKKLTLAPTTIQSSPTPSQNFGKTEVGAVRGTYGSNQWGVAAQLSQDGQVSSMSAYLEWDGTGSNNVKAVIYDDNLGNPNNKKGESEIQTFTTTPAWVTFNFNPPLTLTLGTYWLSILGEEAGVYGYFDTALSNINFFKDNAPYLTAMDPAFGFNLSTHYNSVYATYTPKTSPTPTPSPTIVPTVEPTPSPSPTPSPTLTPVPTSTPSPVPTPSPTPLPSPIPTPDTEPPTVPTNLTAQAVSSSQINLSWNPSTDNVGVSGYDVYRNSIKVATVTTTSFGDTGLLASTTYTYFVRALDAALNVSSNSNSVSAFTQPPPITGNLTGLVYSSSQGASLSGVNISVSLKNFKASSTTNSFGRYSFLNLNPQTYTVTFSKKGYHSHSAKVNIVAGQTKTLNAVLEIK